MKHLAELLALHARLLEQNPHCYFELAYTRTTGWMAWICSKPKAEDPQRVIIAHGQGTTPDDAAVEALRYYAG